MFDLFLGNVSTSSVYATLRQVSGTAFGDRWNHVSSVFQASPSLNDQKIPLTFDTVRNHVGQTATLETYTGKLLVEFFDDSDDSFLESVFADVVLGLEVIVASQKDVKDSEAVILAAIGSIGGVQGLSAVQVDDTRTWFLPSALEARVAPSIITLFPSDVVTLSMDFSGRLNPETTVSTVSSVIDDKAVLTIEDLATDNERKRAHFNITGGLSAGNDHTLTVNIVTIDGQQLTAKGKLQVI